jgi:hypothetical protein
MKKIFSLLALLFFLTGCVESMALLGPASSAVGGGNVAQSTISSAINYGIKKQTGKDALEHAVAYAEKNNPEKKTAKCVSFLDSTDTEVCALLRNKMTDLKSKIKAQSKIKDLNQ